MAIVQNTMNRVINLNADLGESFGPWVMGQDHALLQVVNTANVACGFHAGDPLVMRRTVQAAREAGVSIGAHPSYPDLQGFGRRLMHMNPAELEAALLYQMAALAGIGRAEGHPITHVKPHGALSNQASVDRKIADCVARAICDFDSSLLLLAPAFSQLAEAGHAMGLKVILEGFADRAYQDNGQLVPRSSPHAMIKGVEAAINHVRHMLQHGAIHTVSGQNLPVHIQSICVHGDEPKALATATALRHAIKDMGWETACLPGLRKH